MEACTQNKKCRIEPGRLYEAGETLYAPRFGFTATVPEGWEGMSPVKMKCSCLQAPHQRMEKSMCLDVKKGTWL